MEEQSSKSKSFIIVLVACILIILAIVICVIFFNKKDASVNENEKNVGGNSSQALYHIVDGEEATIFDAALAYNDTEGKTLISFDYPQFDIEGEEIEKINSKIKDIYQRAYNLDFAYEISDISDLTLEIEKGGKYYCTNEMGICEFNTLTYNIYDTGTYLAISFKNLKYCHCSGSSEHFGYVIDKKTKKVLTNSEIVKLFNESEQNIINEYNNNIDKYNCANVKAKTIDDITLYVENNKLVFVNAICN